MKTQAFVQMCGAYLMVVDRAGHDLKAMQLRGDFFGRLIAWAAKHNVELSNVRDGKVWL